jgi:2-polyprenyl-6-methoxyphenol hydroxylase-like FAD-dependent oxidoreductase
VSPTPAAAPGTSALRVAVIGGSLGGLNAALWLAAAGCDVDVYERSTHPLSSRGAGIVVQDDTIRYLVRHGTPLEQISTSTSGRVYFQSGGRSQRMAGEQRFTSWNTLYRHLLAAVDPDRYHLGAAATGFTQDAAGVDVHLSDGTAVRADLVVGADGPRSTVREQLLPGVLPRYAGYVAWRGLVAERDMPAEALELFGNTFAFVELPRSQALCYPIPGPHGETERGQRLLNWLWYRTVPDGAVLDEVMTDRAGLLRTTSLPPGAVHPNQDKVVREDASGLLPPQFQALVASTEELFLQQVVDLSVPRMAFDRVALIGDAAFVPRPHTAGSTMKAAYNGEALAHAVTSAHMDLAVALPRWETEQLSIGRQLEHHGQALARSSGLGSAPTVGRAH